MINFKDIVEGINPEKLSNILTIDGHPVWDYKAIGFTVYLIAEDPWLGSEDEYVTLGELKAYVIKNEIPFNEVKLATEADREVLKTFLFKGKEIYLSH